MATRREKAYDMFAEDVREYLLDIERRWGVRVVFTFRLPTAPAIVGGLIVECNIAHDIHKAELNDPEPTLTHISGEEQSEVFNALWSLAWEWDTKLERHLRLTNDPA